MTNFIIVSILLYVFIFHLIHKILIHDIYKIIVLAFFIGGYLNIADNGKMVKWLNIQLTDDIIYASLGIMIIYIITTFFVFREPYEKE